MKSCESLHENIDRHLASSIVEDVLEHVYPYSYIIYMVYIDILYIWPIYVQLKVKKPSSTGF